MRSSAVLRRAAVLLAAGLSFAGSGAARGDTLSGTVGSVGETRVTVDVRFDRGDATLIVRRTLVNAGTRDDQAILAVEAPSGGVATGLRTLVRDGAWIEGELMDADRAEKRYRELTGFGRAAPRDPVLLSWSGVGSLSLQAFPVTPGTDKTIEYTLRVPAEWKEGRWHVVLPAMGTGDAVPQAVVRAGAEEDSLALDGVAVASHARIALDRPVDVSLAPSARPPIAAGIAVLPLGPQRVAVHAHVEAGHLSAAPRGAWVVVLLDASRSLDEATLAAELAAARAYVSWLPDARFALLAFDRVPHPIVPSFLDARGALAALQTRSVTRRNGSHLDAALAEAARLLADAPAGAPRRILALTDLRVRQSLVPDAARAEIARAGAVLHLASVGAGQPYLSRDDDDPWSAVPRSTGGVLWSAAASVEPDQEPAMRRVFEEWARPLRVDRLKVALHGVAGASLDATSLDEGAGLADARIVTVAPDALSLDGELWSRPVHVSAVPTGDEARLWSALVFGTQLVSEMKDDEMRGLARRGHAVSPVTSLLAVEPGVRPSTSGVPELLGGSGGGGSWSSHCGCCGIGHAGRAPLDVPSILAAAMTPAWRRCGGGSARAHVSVETTSLEVVDVPRSAVDAPAASGALADCLREAAWSIDVPDELAPVSGVWQVEL